MPAVVHLPGAGERLSLGSSEVVIKVGGEDTAGTFFLGESIVAPGFPGPPLHTHKKLHDMFYVLEGTLTFCVEDETLELGPGSFACVPPGVAHTFSNPTDAPARVLNFNTPSGFEHYMRDLAEAVTGDPLTQAAIGEVAVRYDIQLA